jgi:N-acyl-D-aspartate/D-glutamate deacylase
MTAASPSFDVLLAGGSVVDGTGVPPFRADVALRGERIVAVEAGLDRAGAGHVLDVTGLTVAPGFIDAHGHSDIAVLSAPRVPSKIHQGITTEVMGNCGLGVAPIGPETDVAEVRAQLAIVDVDASVPWSWRTMAEYLDVVRRRGSAMNVAMLAGHLGIRATCVGFADRPATSRELAAMQELADTALADGACGLSTGLMYPPNAYANTDELAALAEVVASHGKVFTCHMRDYGDHLVESVEESLSVAERTGVSLQISHLAVVGRRNWGAVTDALRLIDDAAQRGVDVAVDIYTYLAGSTNLTQLLPRWSLEGGASNLLDRLTHPPTRTRIADEVERTRLNEWSDVVIAGGDFPADADVVGRTVAELAERSGRGGAETLITLAQMCKTIATIVAFGRSEDDLVAVLRHPRAMVGSDGLGLDPDGPSGSGQPHPRSYGCYPRLLGRYVRDEGTLTLESAIHKATSQVAQRFGVAERGVVTPGYVADLVVFDATAVDDLATFEQPQQSPVGIDAVFVTGVQVVTDGKQNDALPGRVLA